MLQLLRNVRAYGPEPLGTLDLLIGTDRVVWMGTDPVVLPPSLRVVGAPIVVGPFERTDL